jgi:hypothetical protein
MSGMSGRISSRRLPSFVGLPDNTRLPTLIVFRSFFGMDTASAGIPPDCGTVARASAVVRGGLLRDAFADLCVGLLPERDRFVPCARLAMFAPRP